MKKLLLITAALLLGSLLVNNMLGGFDKVDVDIVEVNDYLIYGQAFAGRYNSDELENRVTRIRQLVEEGTLEGNLVIVNYIDEQKEKRGEVKQFVGVLLINPALLTPVEGLKLLTITASQAVEARIGVRKLVMPSPEKIKKKSLALARQQGLELMDISIETYQGQQLIVHYPVQQ
jgi:hypothetical protein